MKTIYLGVVHKEKGSDYGVSFPDFPGCVSAGKTLEHAIKLGSEALTLHIRGMVEDGEPMPEPTKADEIVHEEKPVAIFPAYISQMRKEKVKRFNIAAWALLIRTLPRALRTTRHS